MKLDPGEIEDAEGYSYFRVGCVRYCFVKTEIVPGWITSEIWMTARSRWRKQSW